MPPYHTKIPEAVGVHIKEELGREDRRYLLSVLADIQSDPASKGQRLGGEELEGMRACGVLLHAGLTVKTFRVVYSVGEFEPGQVYVYAASLASEENVLRHEAKRLKRFLSRGRIGQFLAKLG